ncbi:NAD-dependent formate dehydrogenase [Ceraceosorus guamensis]|uniref:Formate dehydrogenase n=1 Tax=Ceraceosorus guamensis TaxID=1522189 RepID=A0A316WGZ3_9BASI|nr:NAD-dependent formate dehydrogenase [Ceraceosorus guamensis]PWN46365.1 NAD-dependent formate dehydrogenase [Ceraceosorus guamensis]
MVKVVCVLYKGGPAAQEESRLLGTTENKLGMEKYMKDNGHTFIVTDDKEGPNSVLHKEIVDADVVITTPFHPGYINAELIDKAPKLKLAITAGVGSDHVDLNKANERKITVAEVTGSNVVSVAEHVVMSILLLVRNYNVGHAQVYRNKEWYVADIAKNAFDLEGLTVGTIGAGRIGFRVLQRLKPFDCKELLYFDYQNLPSDAEKEVGARRVQDLDDFLSQCDVVTINAPLHEGTKGLMNKEKLSKMRKGSWLVNTARGAICVADDVADAVNSGHLRGYAGDVWDKQPAREDHPWRTMQGPGGPSGSSYGNGMVPHYSGTTISAQKRYAEGALEIFDNWINGKIQTPANIIVENGEYASKAYGQGRGK